MGLSKVNYNLERYIKISNFSKEEVIKMKSKSIQIAKEKYSPFLVASKFDSICKIIID